MINLYYRKAEKSDAELLIEIYNSAFCDDYVRYGECPAYGRTIEQMENSIVSFPKEIAFCDNTPVGVISIEEKGEGIYYKGKIIFIYGGVKVSTGIANLDKRAAVRNRYKIRNLKITDKTTVKLAA